MTKLDPGRRAEYAALDTASNPEDLVGQVLPAEGRWLREHAALVPREQAIVEVGSYTGKSTCCLAVGSGEGNGAFVYAVDLWTTGTSRKGHSFRKYVEALDKGARSSSKFHSEEAWHKFKRRIKQYDVDALIIPRMGASLEVAAEWDVDPGAAVKIGLLFIDAEHTYDAARADFEAWSPKLAKGGVVAMHDYAMKPEHDQGVARFVNELALNTDWYVDEIVFSTAILRRGKRQ